MHTNLGTSEVRSTTACGFSASSPTHWLVRQALLDGRFTPTMCVRLNTSKRGRVGVGEHLTAPRSKRDASCTDNRLFCAYVLLFTEEQAGDWRFPPFSLPSVFFLTGFFFFYIFFGILFALLFFLVFFFFSLEVAQPTLLHSFVFFFFACNNNTFFSCR